MLPIFVASQLSSDDPVDFLKNGWWLVELIDSTERRKCCEACNGSTRPGGTKIQNSTDRGFQSHGGREDGFGDGSGEGTFWLIDWLFYQSLDWILIEQTADHGSRRYPHQGEGTWNCQKETRGHKEGQVQGQGMGLHGLWNWLLTPKTQRPGYPNFTHFLNSGPPFECPRFIVPRASYRDLMVVPNLRCILNCLHHADFWCLLLSLLFIISIIVVIVTIIIKMVTRISLLLQFNNLVYDKMYSMKTVLVDIFIFHLASHSLIGGYFWCAYRLASLVFMRVCILFSIVFFL